MIARNCCLRVKSGIARNISTEAEACLRSQICTEVLIIVAARKPGIPCTSLPSLTTGTPGPTSEALASSAEPRQIAIAHKVADVATHHYIEKEEQP